MTHLTVPGVQSIIKRLRGHGELSSEGLVDGCLNLLGPLEVESNTRQHPISQAREDGILEWDSEDGEGPSAQRVAQMLQLTVATREYQFG